MAPKRKPAVPAARPASPVASRAPKRRKVNHQFVYQPVEGRLYAWGSNPFGALGLGEDEVDKPRPALLPGLEDKVLVQVQCGGMHTVALDDQGNLYTWGVNDEGALGRPTSGNAWLNSPQALEDAYVPGQARLPEGVRVVQVAAGDGFTFALSEDGCIYGWGCFKDDTSGNAAFKAGTPVQRLPALVYQPESVRDRVKKISAGSRHMAALTRKGDVLTWGIANRGQLGRVPRFGPEAKPDFHKFLTPAPVPGLTSLLGPDITDVSCGANTCYVVSKAGYVAGWGLNNMGQLAIPREDNPEDCCFWEPTPLDSLSKVAAIAGGEHHALALLKGRNPKLLAFGGSCYGPLGRRGVPTDDATAGNASFPEPTEVERPDKLAEETISSIAAGPNLSGCTTKEGNLYLWGQGTNHQLAKGDTEDDSIVPERMRRNAAFGLRSVLQISFGGLHAALLAHREEDLRPPAAAPAANGAGPSNAR